MKIEESVKRIKDAVAIYTKMGGKHEFYPGFETRKGSSRIEMVPRGIMVHHTASNFDGASYQKFIFVTGRADVPAPLCNFFVKKDGTIVTGCAYYANHAGANDMTILDSLKDNDVDSVRPLTPGADDGYGNRYLYGFEVATDREWTDEQYMAVIWMCAALCIAFGWDGDTDGDGGLPPVIGHKEATKRKPDPYKDMPQMRQDVLDAIKAMRGAPTPTEPAPAPEKPTSSLPPAFPLPAGHYFGPRSGPAVSVSGYFAHRGKLKPWQEQMRKRGWNIDTDGTYDVQDARVALSFQREKGLRYKDGRIGPETWAAAWLKPIT